MTAAGRASAAGGEARAAPLILTLRMDGESFARLDALRRRFFPPERNHIPAHVTLFHALPGADAVSITRDIAAECGTTRPFRVAATGFRSLGRGVALALRSPELVGLRQRLAREWRDGLTPQDSAPIAPHCTVQNKVSPDEARRTLAELSAGFAPFEIGAEGLLLWHYRGGPWDLARRFSFG